MATANSNGRAASVPVFGTFYPLQRLWDAENGYALFPSEHSARWFVRVNRKALADAEAIALHTGRMFIDPERCASVAQRVAIEMAKGTVPAKDGA